MRRKSKDKGKGAVRQDDSAARPPNGAPPNGMSKINGGIDSSNSPPRAYKSACDLMDASSPASSSSDGRPSSPTSYPPRRPLSPHAISELGKDWEKWLHDLQSEIELLRRVDPDKLFTKKADDVRTKVAAHVLQLKQQLDDGYTAGLKNIHEEITELAERAGFHYAFFSYAYMSRLAFSLAFFFFSAYVCALASMCTGYRTPLIRVLDVDQNVIENVYTLPDIGHDLWSWILTSLGYPCNYIDIYHIPDTVAGWLATFTFIFILTHPRRFLIIRRITIIFGILFLFRAVTVTVTSLPDASPTCVAQFGSASGAYKKQPMFPKVFIRAFRFLLQPTKFVTCGDMIFSGHTTVLIMCAMIFRVYCRGKLLRSKVFFRSFHISENLCWWCRRIVYFISGIGSLLIIGTRLHYTLDVAIAVYLTQRTFRAYHSFIKYPNLARKSTIYLWMLLAWLEAEDIIAVDSEAYELVKRKT